jgi:effector-binding domain-containing protein
VTGPMAHEVVVETVTARSLAAVRRRVRIGEVSTAWKPALDQVWAFLRRHEGLRTDGHNVFLYHHPARREDPMDVDFGVEVGGPFEGEGDVVFAQTPAGQVASTLHAGGYDRLRDAHDAIHAWSKVHGRDIGAASWEIYGDPADDGSVEIQVVYLLA